jgi:thioredoxin-dependent peroxiredoxin
MAKITLRGTEFHTSGNVPTVGSTAPDFQLVDGKLANKTLADFTGKKKLLSIFPSMDTPVCALSTKKFNDHAKAHADTVMLMISADLPFAQGRFCTAEGTADVLPLSMMRSKKFAQDYGVLIEDGPLAGITARAVVVLDANNKVLHSELVSEVAQEPNYEAALKALR